MRDLFAVYAFGAVRECPEADLHTFDVDLWGTNPIGSVGGYSPQIDNELKRICQSFGGRYAKEESGKGVRIVQFRFDGPRPCGRARVRCMTELSDWGLDVGNGLGFETAHHRDAPQEPTGVQRFACEKNGDAYAKA